MKLNDNGLKNRSEWENAGYHLPEFDREQVRKRTIRQPFWIHFGAGNLFRAYQANIAQNLLNQGILDRGLIVAEGYDYEIIEKMNHPHDDLSILATLKANGSIEKTVVGSIMESLALDSDNEKDFTRLKEIFCKDSLQMVSFTITEKGYSLIDGKGTTLSDVERDFKNGPDKPESYMGKVASLLYTRFKNDSLPIAMVSMDNCSHNGEKLYAAIHAFAENWVKCGKADSGFLAYVSDPRQVSFPWTMIDKITPRPDASVEEILKSDGVEELEPVITAKKSYAAPFVNAEECEYLIIEDAFPNQKPPLESAGPIFTTRETVEKVEKMKVCTCLNPLHTTLAIFGCLLGYQLISEEMKNEPLRKLVEKIGYKEGLPVVVNPKILDPKEFIDAVLQIRFPNPFMPDTPQRIATDTSQKLSVRFGETIKAYLANGTCNDGNLTGISLVFAGWLRYLMGIDDNGTAFELSPDPLLNSVRPYVMDIKLGQDFDTNSLKPLLSNASIFGVDLCQAGLADSVCGYFKELCEGKGAVQKTLAKYA